MASVTGASSRFTAVRTTAALVSGLKRFSVALAISCGSGLELPPKPIRSRICHSSVILLLRRADCALLGSGAPLAISLKVILL